jgi:hypothetical protein
MNPERDVGDEFVRARREGRRVHDTRSTATKHTSTRRRPHNMKMIARATRMRRILESVALASLLTACGGGGPASTGTTIPTAIYFGTGHFTGTQTVNGYTSNFNTSPYVLGFVTSTGRYMLLSYSTGSPNVLLDIDSGSGSALNGSFTSSNNLNSWMYPSGTLIYAPQGGTLSSSFVLNANATGQSMNGSIAYAGTQNAVLSFPLGYVGGGNTPATLSAIAKTYTGAFYANINTSGYGNLPPLSSTFTISSAGVLAGTVSNCPLGSTSPPPGPQTPCTVSGSITARSDLNGYDVSISFANGSSTSFVTGFTGKTATGLGYYDSTSGKLMFGAIAPDNTTFSFSN